MVSWRFEGQHVNHNKRLPPAAAQLPRDARQGPPRLRQVTPAKGPESPAVLATGSAEGRPGPRTSRR